MNINNNLQPSPIAKPKKSSFWKRAHISLIVLTAIGATEAAGAIHHELNNGLPISANTVVTEDLAWLYHLIKSKLERPPSVSPIFDNKADKTALRVGVNTEPANEEELAKIQDNITPSENPYSKLPQISVLCPFLLKDGDWIKMSKSYRTPWKETDTGKVYLDQCSLGIRFTVPDKDTEIIPGVIDPKASSIELFKDPPEMLNGKEYFSGAIILVTKHDGSKYAVSFRSDEDVRGLNPLPILDDAPIFENIGDMLSKKGLLITGTTPIMKTGIDDAIISYGGCQIPPDAFTIQNTYFSAFSLFESSNGKALYLPPKS